MSKDARDFTISLVILLLNVLVIAAGARKDMLEKQAEHPRTYGLR